MTSIRALIARNPAKFAALAAIVLNLAVSFGLRLTAEQVAQFNAGLLIILGLIADSVSTPVAAPIVPEGTTVTVTTPPGENDREVTV